jgi:hypothetical protein
MLDNIFIVLATFGLSASRHAFAVREKMLSSLIF